MGDLLAGSQRRDDVERRVDQRAAPLERDAEILGLGHRGWSAPDAEPESVELDVLEYEAAGGVENFISFEDPENDLLIGFCRLRFPGVSPSEARGGSSDPSDGDPVRHELENAALVRELHIYGNEAGVGSEGERADWQHEGYGGRLMETAEELAREAGFEKVSVISGIRAREY